MRLPAVVLGLVLVVAGILRGIGPPRLTVVNAGIHVEHPGVQAIALLVASAGLALWAWALPRRWMRAVAVVAALATTIASIGRVAYRLDADEPGIASRGLLGSTRVAWKDVRRVDTGPALILVWGPGDAQVRVDTGHFTSDQRATLDRIISRRVREAQAPDPRTQRQ